jgi:hypothetical protein
MLRGAVAPRMYLPHAKRPVCAAHDYRAAGARLDSGMTPCKAAGLPDQQ